MRKQKFSTSWEWRFPRNLDFEATWRRRTNIVCAKVECQTPKKWHAWMLFGKPVSFNFLIAHSIFEFWTEQTRCPTMTFSSVGSHSIDLVAWPDPDEHQDATCENYFPGIKQVAPISSCDIRHLRDGNWWRSKRWGITLKLTSSTSHLLFGPCIWFWMIITNVPQARNSRHSQE